jgi:prevent-host-death family protein
MIPAGEFEAHCLRIMDEVRDTGTEVVITQNGTPVAKLVPVDEEIRDSFGALHGTVVYHGDIVSPDHESWDDEPS